MTEPSTDLLMYVDGLVGALNDAQHFAESDDDLPALYGVWLDWDGTTLRFCASDRYVFCEIARVPTVIAEAGQPWVGVIRRDHLDAVLAVARLRDPDCDDAMARLVWTAGTLTVTAGTAPATTDSAPWPGATITVPCDGAPEPWGCPLPLYRKYLGTPATAIGSLLVAPRLIQKFTKVNTEGLPLDLTFTGTESVVLVRIGEWFVGGIMPIKPPKDAPAEVSR